MELVQIQVQQDQLVQVQDQLVLVVQLVQVLQ